jgi:DNA-binding transcriptional MerR regulator
LKSKGFSVSKETKLLQRDVERKINSFLDEIQSEFCSDLRPSEANLAISKAERHIKMLTADIESLLEEDLKNNQLKEIEALRREYDLYVQGVLDSLPDTDTMMSIKNLQKASLKMKDSKALLDENTFEEKTRVFKGTERHGFLWLKKRDVYETTYEDKVDMNEVFNEYQISITNFKKESFNNYSSYSKSIFEDAKEIILKQMDEIDEKFEELIKSLQASEQSKEKKKLALEENRLFLEWFENFSLKLNSVLDLKTF